MRLKSARLFSKIIVCCSECPALNVINGLHYCCLSKVDDARVGWCGKRDRQIDNEDILERKFPYFCPLPNWQPGEGSQ